MGETTDYTYDAAGNVKTRKDGKGQLTTYSYNNRNQLTEVLYADGRKESFSYDAAGNMLTWAGNASGSISYDALNRKTAETVNYGPFQKTYSYTYDTTGNRTGFKTPEGVQYAYAYDKDHRPRTVTFGARAISYQYQGSRLTRITFPNGVTTSLSYTPNNRLSGMAALKGAATVMNQQYGRDNTGNVLSRATEHGVYSYPYDKVYRLTQATNPTLPGETYAYDPVGNRTSSADAAVWQYTQNNELTTYGATTLTYDQNGNTAEQTASGQLTKYTYNTANRLETVLLPGNKTAVYTYDPFGRRVKKQVGTTITWYLYSDEGLVGEYNSKGTFQVGYQYKPNSQWGSNPVLMKAGNAYYYYHNDQLGTPQKMTSDAKGAVVWSATYTSFGKATVTGTVTNNLRFPGQYFDAETGLHYNWHRYYNPTTGRYTQTDPIGFAGGDANLYSYVGQNPGNWVDPWGLVIWPTNYRHVPPGGQFNSPRPCGRTHRALDIRNPLNKRVYATDAGKVNKIWNDGQGGNQILILHNDGTVSGYAHTRSTVKEGDTVEEGAPIGYSDDSGAGPPHLHYTYRPCLNCPKIDPWQHLKNASMPEANR